MLKIIFLERTNLLIKVKAFAKRGYEFHFQFMTCDLEVDQITCH